MTVLQRRTTDEDGAVLVEFAAVFVLFVTLLWGLITYGVIFAAQQTLTHAAAESARATVGQTTEQDAKDLALSTAQEQLNWLGTPGAPAHDDVVFRSCDPPADDQTCVVVTYTYPWDADPLVPPLLDIGVPDQLTGTAVVVWEGL